MDHNQCPLSLTRSAKIRYFVNREAARVNIFVKIRIIKKNGMEQGAWGIEQRA
jgi:hypothetical protein